jgi:hypothetical protein
MIAAMLLARPRPSGEMPIPSDYMSLLSLTDERAKIDTARIAVRIDAMISPPSIKVDLPLSPIQIGSNAITRSPTAQEQQKIDWDRESRLAVQSSVAQMARENSYRDLSSLTPEQLDWVKNNHMEPMPGFQWDQNSRGELLRHGIFKINDYCVLVVVIPFCRFGGKIQYNGDLFRDMHDPKLPD